MKILPRLFVLLNDDNYPISELFCLYFGVSDCECPVCNVLGGCLEALADLTSLWLISAGSPS